MVMVLVVVFIFGVVVVFVCLGAGVVVVGFFCQKCMPQVIPKHACTLDSMKSEWADYAVQA